MMSAEIEAPRITRARRGLAALVALFLPGGGHVVLGRFRRAAGWFLVQSLCAFVGAAGVLAGQLGFWWLCVGMGALAYPAAAIDVLRRR